MRVIPVLRLSVVMGVFGCVSMSLAAETGRPMPVIVVDEPTVIDAPVIFEDPAFPGIVPRKPVRLWAGAFVAPEARFADNRISLVRPETRGQATLPFSALASIQVTANFSASLYDIDGRDALFTDCAECPEPDQLYSASLGTQGGYRLNKGGHLLVLDEQWALLGALFVQARWEPGAFGTSVTPGFSFGLGYQLPHRLR